MSEYYNIEQQVREWVSSTGKAVSRTYPCIVLTQKGRAYLEKHYKNTDNDTLSARTGINKCSLMRIARELGLAKTKQYMHKICVKGGYAMTRKLKEDETLRGKWQARAREVMIKTRAAGKMHGGQSAEAWKRRKRRPKEYAAFLEKRNAAWKTAFDKDARREAYGLDRKTKFVYRPRMTEEKYHQSLRLRSYMRKQGYEIKPASFKAYYTDATKRTEYIEKKANKLGFVVLRKDQT